VSLEGKVVRGRRRRRRKCGDEVDKDDALLKQ
jgi:hypothetical protein